MKMILHHMVLLAAFKGTEHTSKIKFVKNYSEKSVMGTIALLNSMFNSTCILVQESSYCISGVL